MSGISRSLKNSLCLPGIVVLLAGLLLVARPATGAAAQLLAGEREAVVTAIPGVIAAGEEWQLIWADFVTADGIVGTPDGGLLFAQEQTDRIIRLDRDHNEFTFIEDTNGAGAVSLDADGRLYAVLRTCTEPLNAGLAGCNELTMVAMLSPQRRVLTRTFPDGSSLGRVNDVIADGRGGAFFTSGGAWHVSESGVVTTVADQEIRSNGIMLSRDGRTLYVTNNTEVLAFDVNDDGTTRNRRVFGSLDGDDGGDGMAIDAEGRLYVTAAAGVHVLSAAGQHLGLIPTPRRPITLAFSGPDKQMLYVPQMGAVGPDGQVWETPEGIRNTAMTIYRIPTLAQGFQGRPK